MTCLWFTSGGLGDHHYITDAEQLSGREDAYVERQSTAWPLMSAEKMSHAVAEWGREGEVTLGSSDWGGLHG